MKQSEQGKTKKRLPDSTMEVAASQKSKEKDLKKPQKDKMLRGAETK